MNMYLSMKLDDGNTISVNGQRDHLLEVVATYVAMNRLAGFQIHDEVGRTVSCDHELYVEGALR